MYPSYSRFSWIYPVDKQRVNEFGYSAEDGNSNVKNEQPDTESKALEEPREHLQRDTHLGELENID
jgi:hypothetical protein